MGARKTPFLKSSLVRWSSFARFVGRGLGEGEGGLDRQDMKGAMIRLEGRTI